MKPFFAWLDESFSGKTVLIIGHRATHYGVEYYATHKSLQECTAAKWHWQPGWKYQLTQK
jgi:hypothetical protein